MCFEADWANPPREFTLMPFWFWNDVLDADEIRRQIAEFDVNGVYGFVIHPRVGLPRDCGWMSDKLLGFYRVAIEEAARRDMRVLLYDEGMYPSGSSCGQLVERHPDLACRCLALHDVGDTLPTDATVIQRFFDAGGQEKLIVDRRAKSVIRGLHYIDESTGREDEPPAGDILNPRTAAAITGLVHEKFFAAFGEHFGKTILGVFTDEPNPLGRLKEKKVFAYTPGLLAHVNRLLGYDFEPHLPNLWADGKEGDRYRKDWRHAVRLRLEETWYKPLSDWCESHGVALCGHPDAGDEIGVQRHFQIPGQDLVWRWVLPDHPTALEGPESTQAKCSASAMVHHGRRRNSNEFAGAYGHGTTFDEVKWLADWCFVRGVNLLIPHAFYYSVRGPRRDERPPQLGPHTPEWTNGQFKVFVDHCRRLSWLNTDCEPVVRIAILTHDDRCPWPAAKALLTHQRDFHYLDPATLLESGQIAGETLHVGAMRYDAVVIDGTDALAADVANTLRLMTEAGRVIRYTADSPAELVAKLDSLTPPAVTVLTKDISTQLRVRIVKKQGKTALILWNESLKSAVTASVQVCDQLWKLHSICEQGSISVPNSEIFQLSAGELRVFLFTKS
ncbi:MAG: glycosyl hydrolase [Tepidisphaeraceae bacterium]